MLAQELDKPKGLKHLELLTVFFEEYLKILTVQNTVIHTIKIVIIYFHALKFSQMLT